MPYANKGFSGVDMAALTGGTSQGGASEGVLFLMDCDLFTFSTDSLVNYSRRKSANYAQTLILGAENSLMSYSNSSPMEINLSLSLAVLDSRDLQDWMEMLDQWMAVVSPYEEGIEPPTICKLTFAGKLMRNFETLLVTVEETMPLNQIYTQQGEPMDAGINLSFIELTREAKRSATDWASGGGAFDIVYGPNYLLSRGTQ